jgi:uncharacterized protein (TIGR02996 family)
MGETGEGAKMSRVENAAARRRGGSTSDPAEDQFRKALGEAPHDATTRLVFADWLAERGRHDDELVQRLLGTRAVLVRNPRPSEHNRRPGAEVWDLLLHGYDRLAEHLDREHRYFVLADGGPTIYGPAAARFPLPWSRHSYRSPAEAEADLLRAHRVLLQSGRAG